MVVSESPVSPKEKKAKAIRAFTVVVRCPRCDTVFLDLLIDPVVCPVCGFELPINDFAEVPE